MNISEFHKEKPFNINEVMPLTEHQERLKERDNAKIRLDGELISVKELLNNKPFMTWDKQHKTGDELFKIIMEVK
jgi:hypothetical protein